MAQDKLEKAANAFSDMLEKTTSEIYGLPKNMTGSEKNPLNCRLLGGDNVRYNFTTPWGGKLSFSASASLTQEELEEIKSDAMKAAAETMAFSALPEVERLKHYLAICTQALKDLYKAGQIDLRNEDFVELAKNEPYMKLRKKVLGVEMILLQVPNEYKPYFKKFGEDDIDD